MWISSILDIGCSAISRSLSMSSSKALVMEKCETYDFICFILLEEIKWKKSGWCGWKLMEVLSRSVTKLLLNQYVFNIYILKTINYRVKFYVEPFRIVYFVDCPIADFG